MLLLFAALAAQSTPNPSPPAPDIVVTGGIADASSELQACLARNCTPNEDIDATLKLAETQLMAGKYRDARTTLLRSLGRNKEHARAYPIPVSDLYRANGKVAAHLGFDKDYYASTWGIYRTLKNGLPSSDHRRFTSMMEVAEMMYRTRGHERARLYYDSIADDARSAGRPDIAALAELRSAIRHLPPGSSMQMREIRRVASLDGKTMRAPVLEAKMAMARIAYQKGDEAEAQKIQNEIAQLNVRRPMLIYSPPYEMVQREMDSGSDFAFPFKPGVGEVPTPPGADVGLQNRGAVTRNLALAQWSQLKRVSGNFDDMWVDVGFRIDPQGRVTDAKIVRSKGDLFWTKLLMTSIALRRYTAGRPNDPMSTRLERYTYTSGYEVQTGSRGTLRSPKARVEYVDLSDIASPE
jgi:hypothetical protein